jgi:Tol biopolymer transport system component
VEQDGEKTLANIFTIPADGGPDRRLTDMSHPCDGPDYTPDGKWIYFNSEHGSQAEGHAQIFRMAPDGSGLEQVTYDERVNWFPHISPDGEKIIYLSYPPDTIGHPADHDVILRLLVQGGSPRDLARFNGGQGTINVNSWSPDSRHIAYVEFPFR